MTCPNNLRPAAALIVGAVVLAAVACAAPERYALDEGFATVDASRGLSGVTVSANGVTFQPFYGAAVIGRKGRRDPSIRMTLRVERDGTALRLHLSCDHPDARGIHPGSVRGLGEWRRLDLSRQAENYGQMWWPKTIYSVQGDLWFTAHWVLEESDATSWRALSQENQGTRPFAAAHQVDYAPDTAGTYLPVHEALELRVSRNLWDVVPYPKQPPSEYACDLASSVQLDLWGGRAAGELEHLLQVLGTAGQPSLRFLSILQNWQTGGFDSLLPDSVWMPDYPPNIGVGTVEELRSLCDLGKSLGRFGFRTNYRILRRNSPSFLKGIAHFAVDSAGRELDYMSPGDWPAVAGRQEKEIAELWQPDASFTDQLTAGAFPTAWHDHDAERGSRSLRATLGRQRSLARLIKETHSGPLGSETLMDQELLGFYVDTGDFGIGNGHNRLFSPEFKLRRLQHLSTFHGMGLMYRFYEFPPFPAFHSGTTTFGTDQAQLDDYRCCEVMYGNGAYVCYSFANWRYWLTETLLIGHLQRHYALQPVSAVRYLQDGAWRTLEELVEGGTVPVTSPWAPQSQAYGRVRVEYASGLTVVVNRLPEPLPVTDAKPDGIILPQYGWVAWKPDGTFVAFSADWPCTDQRVDYLRDDPLQIEFIDPRGNLVRGVDKITFWRHGRPVVVADPEANCITVRGEQMPLNLPAPPPAERLSVGFDGSLENWRIGEGILNARLEDGALVLDTVSGDPQLYSPALALDGDRVKRLEFRLKADAGELAQLYFITASATHYSEDRVFRVPIVPDGQWHTYCVEAAGHPAWRGQRIIGLRFDPIHGPARAKVSVDCLREVE